jgi:hypothetical protein
MGFMGCLLQLGSQSAFTTNPFLPNIQLLNVNLIGSKLEASLRIISKAINTIS